MKRLIGYRRGGGNKQRPNAMDTSKKLEKRESQFGGKIEKIDQQLLDLKQKMKNARSTAQRNTLKKRALMLLRQKKMYSRQQETLMSQQMNIDSISFATENLRTNMETVSVMKDTTKELKRGIKNMDIDKVLDMREELDDLMMESEEINEALSRPFEVPDSFDEEDLLEELDSIEDEIALEDSAGLLDSISVPQSSGSQVPVAESTPQDETRMLENELLN